MFILILRCNKKKLRIYEEGAMAEDAKGVPVDILRKFNEKDAVKRPTKSDVVKYKLWLEQHYHSPYTGRESLWQSCLRQLMR